MIGTAMMKYFLLHTELIKPVVAPFSTAKVNLNGLTPIKFSLAGSWFFFPN